MTINETFDKIMSILERNQYQIIAYINSTGIMIHYPERLEIPSSPPKIDEIIISNNELTINGDVISVPNYLQTSYCISILIKNAKKIKYSGFLIRYVYNNKDISDDEFWKIAPFDLNEEELILSDQVPKLVDLYTEDKELAFKMAKDLNISDGLQTIIELLQGEN